MKHRLLSASLVGSLSMVATPAMAQAVTGHVAVTGGNVKIETGVTPTEADTLGAQGAIFVPLTNGIVVQGDVSLDRIDGGSSNTNATTLSGHVGYRNAQWAVAGFVGASDSEALDATGLYLGAEALYYGPAFTLSAAIGSGEIDDLDTDLKGATGEGRLFVSDNFRLDARLGLFDRDVGPAGQNGISYGIGVEWKPDSFPVGVFATYDSVSLDDTDFDLSTFLVGIRFDFGNGTLKLRDRTGATFRPMGDLALFAHQF